MPRFKKFIVARFYVPGAETNTTRQREQTREKQEVEQNRETLFWVLRVLVTSRSILLLRSSNGSGESLWIRWAIKLGLG